MNNQKNRNITPKIVSVFIGIIMWTLVMGEVNPVQTKEFSNLEVVFLNEASLQQSGLVLMEPKDAKVTVKVTGRLNEINALTKEDIIVQADLWGYSEGSNKVPIEAKIPENVDIASISPSQLVFNFDSIITKEKPVQLNTIGKVADGYSLGKGQVNPSTVLVKGPKSLVNSVTKVIASVDITDKNSDISTDVPIKVVDDNGNEVSGVTKEPSTVSAYLPILMTKSVTIEAVTNGSPLVGFEATSIEVEPNTILIKGYEKDIKDINSIKTEPIDLSFLTVDRQLETNVVLPEGVQLVDSDAKITANIKIEEIIEKEIEYDIEEISFTNLNEQLTLEIPEDQEKIIITVRGLKSTIENLDKSFIKLHADLLELGAGEHSVNIEVTNPNDIELINITPESVQVTLQEEL